MGFTIDFKPIDQLLWHPKSKIQQIKNWLSTLSTLERDRGQRDALKRRITAAQKLLRVAIMERDLIHAIKDPDATYEADVRELHDLDVRIKIWMQQYPQF